VILNGVCHGEFRLGYKSLYNLHLSPHLFVAHQKLRYKIIISARVLENSDIFCNFNSE
jgi:hypothetical protein